MQHDDRRRQSFSNVVVRIAWNSVFFLFFVFSFRCVFLRGLAWKREIKKNGRHHGAHTHTRVSAFSECDEWIICWIIIIIICVDVDAVSCAHISIKLWLQYSREHNSSEFVGMWSMMQLVAATIFNYYSYFVGASSVQKYRSSLSYPPECFRIRWSNQTICKTKCQTFSPTELNDLYDTHFCAATRADDKRHSSREWNSFVREMASDCHRRCCCFFGSLSSPFAFLTSAP